MQDRKSFSFFSLIHYGTEIPEFDQTTVKNEPMLFSCDWEAASSLGGPITKAFLDAFIKDREHLFDTIPPDIIIDTRVHMLMPGWYPAIPGYHHDDIPRLRLDGQPEYRDGNALRAKHVMALVNGHIAPTEFALGSLSLDEVLPEEGPVYARWHKDVLEALQNNTLTKVNAASNRLLYFDAETFHQGIGAVANGWRWFGRMSWNTTRKPVNEIRRQVQVYLEFPMEGW